MIGSPFQETNSYSSGYLSRKLRYVSVGCPSAFVITSTQWRSASTQTCQYHRPPRKDALVAISAFPRPIFGTTSQRAASESCSCACGHTLLAVPPQRPFSSSVLIRTLPKFCHRAARQSALPPKRFPWSGQIVVNVNSSRVATTARRQHALGGAEGSAGTW